jgi:cytochrome c oxidase subunit 1
MLGVHGMPRRYYNYPEHFTDLNVLSTVGSYVLAVGFVIALIALLHAVYRGRPAPANPWGGASMEWRCSSPPPHNNFDEPPPVNDPYDFTQVKYDAETESYSFVDEERTS